MNAPLRRVAIAALLLFALLIANANYVQVFQGPELRANPGNVRVLLDEYERQRGAIVVDGASVALSKETNDRLRYLRQYPGRQVYAPATGFYSLIYGPTGIERAESDVLTGSDNRLFIRRLSDLLTGRDPKGGNVVLTLRKAAQQAAWNGLDGRRGAVVALDPRTGAILAMASSPSYDPTQLSSHDPRSIRDTWERLNADAADPLLNRAISQSYPPGSTFKVVTAAAALQRGLTPDSRIPCKLEYAPESGGKPLTNFGREPCDGDPTTLKQALTQSYNTAFAELGVGLGEAAVREQAAAFGLDGDTRQIPLPAAASQVCDPRSDPVDSDGRCRIFDEAALAQSSIGQRNVKMTPLQGAMIAATVANRGRLMRPYLVKELQAPDLSTLDATEPEPVDPERPEAIPPEVADQLKTMMINVVENGTGQSADLGDIQVAGKTGTAENAPGKQPHAWFIGFAPADNPTVAVAVVLENAGNSGDEVTGGKAAAPIAAAVIKAAIDAQRGGG